MNKGKGCFRWGTVLGGLIALAICLLAAGIYYFYIQAHAFNLRPLVLIHNPLNRDFITVGNPVVIHATARSQAGIARMEVWVDNILVASREAESGIKANSLVLLLDWVPAGVGGHNIVVRAFSTTGVNEQSSVSITAVENVAVLTHRVQEGETLETVASEFGTTPDELVNLNPGVDPSGIAPGDNLIVSEGTEGDEASHGETFSESGGVAPFLWEEAPTLFFGFFELLGIDNEPDAPIRLRVEALSLQTSASFEGLHCYVGVGENSPKWVPDLDGNPATDESFSIESETNWNVSDYLVGENAPTFFWTNNQPIPFEITCVGISGGGTEPFELGRLAMEISPEGWTGIPLTGEATGTGGSFTIQFRVRHLGVGVQGAPKELDPNMATPVNLRTANYYALIAPFGDEEGVSNFFVSPDDPVALLWDYNPDPNAVPIAGFLVYLNDNLMWMERTDRMLGSTHYTVLPSQWQYPPCGEEYVITVSAWRPGGTDGYESPTADPPIVFEIPAEDCVHGVQITFLTLHTYNLGDDGDEGDRTGDIGPAYGHFFANEEMVTFSGGSLEGEDGYYNSRTIDLPYGLSHYTQYDLNEIFSTWISSSRRPTLYVRIPDGDDFEFGFHIMDDDDRNSDDLICEGMITLRAEAPNEFDNYHGELDRETEGIIQSWDGRCEVRYRLEPLAGSPVGSGNAGTGEVLPWIEAEDVVFDEAGNARVHVRNTGTADWVNRDLVVELQSREGLSLGIYTWPDFTLYAGDDTDLTSPTMRLSPPLDACALIDPYDDVAEEREASDARTHTPFCPELPDLVITHVEYDPAAGGINVTVLNRGGGNVENRSLSIQTYSPDGSQLPVASSWRGVSFARTGVMGAEHERTFLIPVTESARSSLEGGYSVVVNPDNHIVESNTLNNAFVVPASKQLMIRLMGLRVLYNYRNSTEFFFTAFVGSGAERRQVANYHFEDIDFVSCEAWTEHRNNDYRRCYAELYPPNADYSTPWFPISGDETLEINVRTTHRGGFDTTRSYAWQLNDPHIDPWWGSQQNCNNLTRGYIVGVHFLEPIDSDQMGYDEFSNALSFQVCQDNPDR